MNRLTDSNATKRLKSRQALDWLLAQHPCSHVHLHSPGIGWAVDLEGWVYQRGYPSYRVVLVQPGEDTDGPNWWKAFAISQSGRVYRVVDGVAEREEIWKP